MTPKATLTVGVALVAAFFVGWLVKPTPETQSRTTRAGGDGGMVAKADYDKVVRELEVERKQRDELTEQVADLKERAKAAADGGGGARSAKKESAAATGPRFHFDKWEDALKEVDWKVVGESLNAMPPLMAELIAALSEGKPIPPSYGQIQRYNGPLLEQALKLQQAGLPGDSVNAVFTHPVAQVNMVYATLRQAGKPLNADQEERLGRIGSRFVELDAERVAAYDDATLGLKRLIDETALKDKFYEAVDALLTPEQRTVLHPPATAGYISADLFSSGLVWGPMTRTIIYSTREDLEAQMLGRVTARLQLDEATTAAARPIVGTWSRSMPTKYLDVPANAAVRNRLIKVARVRSAAHAQLKLQHELLGQLPLSAGQRESLRNNTVVFVPFRQPGPASAEGDAGAGG